MKNVIVIICSTLIFVSCAHYPDVRPGAKGVHKVKVNSESKEAGTQDAISQARDFCEERDLQAAFLEEKEQYIGDMKESDYKAQQGMAKTIEKVAGATWVFSEKQATKDLGMAGMIGGKAYSDVLGKGYLVEMKFKCL